VAQHHETDSAERTDYAPFPHWLRELERDLYRERRKLAGIQTAPSPGADHRIGLALSGGGVRSATFCLGVLRALAQSGLLRQFDYLSTVSGGSYIGSFLGALFNAEKPVPTAARQDSASPLGDAGTGAQQFFVASPVPGNPGERATKVEEALKREPDSWEIKWLRENGRYLAPSGSAGNWLVIAVVLRNWLAVELVLFLGAFSVAYVALVAKIALRHILAAVPLLASLVKHNEFLCVPALALAFALGCGTAYWFVPTPAGTGFYPGLGGFVVACALAALIAVANKTLGVIGGAWLLVVIVVWVATAVACGSKSPHRPDYDGRRRSCATHWLAIALQVAVIGTALWAIDSLGSFLCGAISKAEHHAKFRAGLAALIAVITPVLGYTKQLLALLGDKKEKGASGRLLLSVVVIILAAGVVLTLGGLGSFCAYLLVKPPLSSKVLDPSFMHARAVALVFISIVLGAFHAFVNGSTLSAFYASSLARTYLGAANPKRRDAKRRDAANDDGTRPIEGDRPTLDDYHPHTRGGPLHLINVTVNETLNTRSMLSEPDRKGLPMAIGPASLSVAVNHHAKRRPGMELEPPPRIGNKGKFRVFPKFVEGRPIRCETLDVPDWVALSGAAVAPGLGPDTRTSRSILLTAFNLRLGRWWDSGIEPRLRDPKALWKRWQTAQRALATARHYLFVPAYVSLVREALALFPGTARRLWYVTDGGHFENTACYELIRRRLGLIVCCDAGADPDYTFDDLGNLVRLARVDFGAEIEFLDDKSLTKILAPSVRPFFGTLEQLSRQGTRAAGATKPVCAALARVRYAEHDSAWPDAPPLGYLVLLKPVVAASAPQDIRSYRAAHPSFPQETTADQFFDDAQWEAYRRLGEQIGSNVFKSTAGEEGWSPHQVQHALDPTPKAQDATGIEHEGGNAGRKDQ
jgi:hypothetical protein